MSLISGKIRIGSRSSKLAQKQVAEIIELLSPHIKPDQIEVILINTSGDKIQDRNLAEIGGKGLFIKELEDALIQNKIDIAIHSAKDVPPHLHESTTLAAFTKRLDPRDCFISKKYKSIEELPQGAVVGTSSARRKAILLKLRPDLKIVNFRGNVDTRLKKIENNEVDATILAICGLTRLAKNNNQTNAQISCPKGYDNKNIIEKEIMLPAGGQGALALQIRKNNAEVAALLNKINHQETQICVETERAFLSALGASCATPVAVYADITNDVLRLQTMILDYDGSEVFTTNLTTNPNLQDATDLGIAAAQKTKSEALDLIKRIF